MDMTHLAHKPRMRSHPGRLLWRCAAAATCALLASACGSAAAPGPGTPGTGAAGEHSSSAPASSAPGTGAPAGSTSGSAVAAAAEISLEVSFSGSASAAGSSYTLRCDPDGGTVSDPAASCATLMRGVSLFGPLPAHVACPMVMADAGRATVTGSFLGRPVHETIVDGGCDLSRWAKLRQVFS